LRFGTDPKLLGWYVEVFKGSGLHDPVNLKRKEIEYRMKSAAR